MRSRSLLATSFLAVLLGCPSFGQAPSESASNPNGDDGRPGNSEAHDDPMDAPLDLTWRGADPVPAGESALRLLMTTHAPIEADNVFVTFCGVYVEPLPERAPAEIPSPATGPSQPGRDGAGGSGGAGSDDGRDGYAGEPATAGRTGYGGEGGYAGGYGEPCAGCGGAEPPPEEPAPEREPEPAPTDTRDPDAHDEVAPAPDGDVDGREPEVSTDDPARPAPEQDPEHPTSDSEGLEARRVSDECQTLDLLTLQDGVTEAVGIARLPAGEYGNIWMVVTDASIVMRGFEYRLDLPSGEESGVKVSGAFRLNDGGATTVTLDFNAARSITSAPSGYMLAPVIHMVSVDHHDGSGPRAPEGAALPPPPSDETRPAEPMPGAPRPPEPPPPSYDDEAAAREAELARREEEARREAEAAAEQPASSEDDAPSAEEPPPRPS